MEEIERIFESRKEDGRFNTSYPLHPDDWASYRVQGSLPFPDKELSLYVHIPFCKSLCSFCEYTKMICPEESVQIHYVETLRKDILEWLSSHQNLTVRGFDIGGGTPTALCDKAFERLMDLFSEVKGMVRLSGDFEPSIEGTFQTLTEDKLKLIAGAGIRRISLGIQSTDGSVLQKSCRRNVSLDDTIVKREKLNAAGIEKLNIDLMYGLNGQSTDNCRMDIDWIARIAPEQVTVYEFRPNMTTGYKEMDKKALYELYCTLYEGIIALGYQGRFGGNTFSKNPDDLGVSSYLRSRMKEGLPYKGFGLSAQSMSSKGISYNLGKGRRNLGQLITSDSFLEEYTYVIPPQELMAKYIAIAAYCGEFSVARASELLGEDFQKRCSDRLEWCLTRGLLSMVGDTVKITREGFQHYGAVFSLFYSI